MRSKKDQDRNRFERMAIRVAALLLAKDPVATYNDIPEHLKAHFETLTYCELIRPLVHQDRTEKNHPMRKISISYGITFSEARTILKKKRANF